MKFSIVIPVVPKHDRYLNDVFASLSTESNLIREIIVARSEIAPHKVKRYEKFLRKISSKYNLEDKVILSGEPRACLAYANLNRGWRLAKGEYVTFLGADDLYAPNRLSVINEVLNQYPESNLVLHSYFFENQSTAKSTSSDGKFKMQHVDDHLSHFVKERIIDSSEILKATFPAGKRDFLSECFGNTSIKVPSNKFELSTVAQGNATVKTSLREKVVYKQLQYGEDGVLCLDILENFGNVFFIALELSVYRKHLSANRIPTRLSYLKHKLLGLAPKKLVKIIYS
jgi:glycosyltransferase involved in cell wall biosynthesis